MTGLSDSSDCVSDHHTNQPPAFKVIILLDGELLDVQIANMILNVCMVLNASIVHTAHDGLSQCLWNSDSVASYGLQSQVIERIDHF